MANKMTTTATTNPLNKQTQYIDKQTKRNFMHTTLNMPESITFTS